MISILWYTRFLLSKKANFASANPTFCKKSKIWQNADEFSKKSAYNLIKENEKFNRNRQNLSRENKKRQMNMSRRKKKFLPISTKKRLMQGTKIEKLEIEPLT